MTVIDTLEKLEALYGEAGGVSLTKEVHQLTPEYQRWIEAAPFFAIATSGPGGLDCSPRGVRRRHDSNASRDHAKPGHVHAAHIHIVGESEHVAPRERGDHPERAGDDQAISPQHCFQGAVGHLLRMPLPTGHFAKCITTDLTSGSARSDRSCRNYPNACRDR